MMSGSGMADLPRAALSKDGSRTRAHRTRGHRAYPSEQDRCGRGTDPDRFLHVPLRGTIVAVCISTRAPHIMGPTESPTARSRGVQTSKARATLSTTGPNVATWLGRRADARDRAPTGRDSCSRAGGIPRRISLGRGDFPTQLALVEKRPGARVRGRAGQRLVEHDAGAVPVA